MKSIQECLRAKKREELIDAACRLGVLPEGEFSTSRRFYAELVEAALQDNAPAVRRALTLSGIDAIREAFKANMPPKGEALNVVWEDVEDEHLMDALERLERLGLADADADAWQVQPEVWELTHYPEAEQAQLAAEEELGLAAEGYLQLYGMLPETRLAKYVSGELADLPAGDLLDVMEARGGISVTYEAAGEIWLCAPVVGDAEQLCRCIMSEAAHDLPWASFDRETVVTAALLGLSGDMQFYGAMEDWLIRQEVDAEPSVILGVAMDAAQEAGDDAAAACIEDDLGHPLDEEGQRLLAELLDKLPRWQLRGWSRAAALREHGVTLDAVQWTPFTAWQNPDAWETPKVGRNDPCPCGSGKKYKQCCGKNA